MTQRLRNYQTEITNRYAALENARTDINRAWESTEENIKTSATESRYA